MQKKQKTAEEIRGDIRQMEEAEKTPEGIAIAAKRDKAEEEARKVCYDATHAAFKEYSEAWRPLREKWEVFNRPHMLAADKAILKANNTYFDEMNTLRKEDKGGVR